MKGVSQGSDRAVSGIGKGFTGGGMQMAIGSQMVRVSVGANGLQQGDGVSGGSSLAVSRDGNLVGFYSLASNLFSPNPYGGDFVLKNLTNQSITAITTGLNGDTSNGLSGGASSAVGQLSLTPDGRYAVFGSSSHLMAPTLDASGEDIFRFDLAGSERVLASLAQGGVNSYHSLAPDVSDNGRYIVFTNMDNLLSQADVNSATNTDVYWYDTQTHLLQLASGALDGSLQGDSDSDSVHVTNDGRYVVFSSTASNLLLFPDGGKSAQIYLRDMASDTVGLLSVSAAGEPGNGNSASVQITPDGHFVVFKSYANNFLANDVSGYDLFRLDLNTGEMALVNTSASGQQINGAIDDPQITPDGRYVVFTSYAGSLVGLAYSAQNQVFVKDMQTGNIAMVSVDEKGVPGTGAAKAPQISDDGQYIVFSTTSALLGSDTNGLEDVYRVTNPVYAWGSDLSNDIFTDSPENQTFVGKGSIDLVVYSGLKSEHAIAKTPSGYRVAAAAQVDELTGVERLQFWDKKVGLDVHEGGHSALAIGFIGAVAPAFVNDLAARGTILSLLDQEVTMDQLSQLALDLKLLPTTHSVDLATAVYRNVLSADPDANMTNALVAYIGEHGMANFVSTVAGLHINVDLVGLQQTGMEYL